MTDIPKLTHFLQHTLFPERARRVDAASDAREDVSQWRELLQHLDALATRVDASSAPEACGFDALVDIGGEIRANARVRDARRVFVDVGLGFKAELTLEEAKAVAARRLRDAERAETERREACVDIERSIKTMERGILQLVAQRGGG